MSDLFDLIESLIELFKSADSIFENFAAILSGIALIIETIVSVIGIIGAILTAICSFIYFVVTYFARAIPIYIVAKKANCKLSWLVWIPFFQKLLCIFVMSKTSGKENFQVLNGKVNVKQGDLVMLGYVLVYFFGSAIVTALIGVLNVLPAIGQIAGLVATLLYILPTFAMAVVKYVYLRDIIGVFKPDEKTNQTHAFIVTILDTFVTSGWAMIIYLMTLIRLNPLPKAEDAPQQEDNAQQNEPLLLEQQV